MSDLALVVTFFGLWYFTGFVLALVGTIVVFIIGFILLALLQPQP